MRTEIRLTITANRWRAMYFLRRNKLRMRTHSLLTKEKRFRLDREFLWNRTYAVEDSKVRSRAIHCPFLHSNARQI